MRQGRTSGEAFKKAVMRIIQRRLEATKALQGSLLAINRNGEVGACATRHGVTHAMCDAQKQDALPLSASIDAASEP